MQDLMEYPALKFDNMKLHISGERLIREVQEEFNKAYPYLKIEFFSKAHAYKQASASGLRIPPKLTISEAVKKNIHSDGEIELAEGMTVFELERELQDQFDLHAQVLRQSGNIWLETTITDGWSLKEQNDHGREISSSR